MPFDDVDEPASKVAATPGSASSTPNLSDFSVKTDYNIKGEPTESFTGTSTVEPDDGAEAPSNPEMLVEMVMDAELEVSDNAPS